MPPIDKTVRCDCGHEVPRRQRDAELVAEIRRHALEAHGMRLARDQALVIASSAPGVGEAEGGEE